MGVPLTDVKTGSLPPGFSCGSILIWTLRLPSMWRVRGGSTRWTTGSSLPSSYSMKSVGNPACAILALMPMTPMRGFTSSPIVATTWLASAVALIMSIGICLFILCLLLLDVALIDERLVDVGHNHSFDTARNFVWHPIDLDGHHALAFQLDGVGRRRGAGGRSSRLPSRLLFLGPLVRNLFRSSRFFGSFLLLDVFVSWLLGHV